MNTLAPVLCLFFQIFTLTFLANPAGFQVTFKSRSTVVVDFSGEGRYEVFPSSKWQFFGPVRSITLIEGQKIVATATAVLGTNSGKTRAATALCHQASANGPIIPFVADNHLNVDVDAVRRPYSVTGTVSLPAGTYSIGYCLVNSGSEVIGNNNYVNGWAMTTD
ncbi:MAG: hypothetical protein IPN69_15515 [Acidobacteria bacterium]|nr:hypothetical protein [Acidobacteriota bacterium]MBK8812119.1 hypothetical protein [Acidobacteriota bacterium]